MLLYITLSSIILAFAISLICFRLNYPVHLKFLSVFLGLTVLSELVALYLVESRMGNIALYNTVMGLEFCAYAYFFKLILKSRRQQRMITWFLCIFPAFWFGVTFGVFGIDSWNSYLAVASSLFIIYWAIMYYYELFQATTLVKLSTCAEFWIATALIIYYAGNLPYTGMMNYLFTHFPGLAMKLRALLQILNILLYSIISYAYLCRIPIRKSS